MTSWMKTGWRLLAAHTWKRTGRSSNVRSPNSSRSACVSGLADHRWVPVDTALRTVRRGLSPYTCALCGAAAPRQSFREQLDTPKVRRFPRRYAA